MREIWLEKARKHSGDPAGFTASLFGVELTPKQREMFSLAPRITTKVAGRRVGKSLITLLEVFWHCFQKPRQKWYVVAPSIDQARIYFQEFEQRLENPLLDVWVKDIKWSPFPEILLVNGSKIMARSTSRDGVYLRGKGADGVAITEAAFVKDKVYYDVIRAMVLDRGGKVRIETTPNGTQGYVYQLFGQGLRDESGYYKSFHATIYDNPRIPRDEIERIRREIPEVAFRIEYLAEFVDDDTAVFPWAVLQDVFEDYTPLGKPEPGHRYSIGVDLAKYQDYTVITVLDISEPPYKIAEWYRYRGRLYGDIVAHVNELQAKYSAKVYLDATGVGDPVAEQVRNCEPFVFTVRSREELISNLVVQVEQKKLLLPAGNTMLRDELRCFQRVRRGTTVKAEAPEGRHDDCVMSLALACWAVKATKQPQIFWL
ncbi:Mu-like prophage FluMu protein gp28 [Thermanaeromonas toyohensis ToBE]|uniref:Mu-like prophage FluMu protein gp28 n=1 Tax=Thermanaeromonas toyohensis ToBE TaxID=698762 RepID=A0A1W1VXJ6_9FIRM|nr:Mu-like prophage FluMu protein gp28 [Thermanaeromonas toyohensis ToBE]